MRLQPGKIAPILVICSLASGAFAAGGPLGIDHPAVWSLAALPVYIGTARLKAQAHWQTDVLAGAALGGDIGYYESARESA